MVDIKVKNRLINKIQQINSNEIINDINRLLEIDIDEDIYVTNQQQRKIVSEALNQIKTGKVLSEEESNKRTEECLRKER